MSNYKANDHLTDTLAQNKRAIEYHREKLVTMVADLEALISDENYYNFDSSLWIEGHVAEEVAHMASLLARQRALIDVQAMIARESEQDQ